MFPISRLHLVLIESSQDINTFWWNGQKFILQINAHDLAIIQHHTVCYCFQVHIYHLGLTM